ncbi:MAG TPA: S9 family peptidase [Acidimicrobiia bacterium]
MRPEDIAKLHIPSEPRLTPDGTRVFFGISRPNVEDDRYDRAIWVHEDGEARQFTSGPSDFMPRVSPDGKRLAFLRIPEGKKAAQVAVMPLDGGEARLVTDLEFGIEALEWSPDGTMLAVVGVTPIDEWSALDEDERSRRPRRMTSIPFRYDNMGWTHDRRRHIWLVPSDDGEARCITEGDWDEGSPAWSPDGSKIAFLSNRDERRGLVAGTEGWEVEVASGEVTKVLERGWWSHLSYRSDGALHALGSPGELYPTVSALYRRETDGSLTGLTTHLDRSSMSLVGGAPFVRWDGDAAVVALETQGRVGLIRVEPDGTVEDLVSSPVVVSGADVAGGRTVATVVTPDHPGELYDVQRGEGGTRITRINRPEEIGIRQPEHFTIGEGAEEIDVWVILPEGEEKVPLLLNIHGGPASQYSHVFFDEFQVYAEAGYGVVYSNPRGSAGRGLDFVRSVVGDGWGKVDLEDIRRVVDAALQRYPRLDPERMGIMGGSYGGFLTAWVIGHEDRWKSAVVERALISWTSFAGTSDIAGAFPDAYSGTRYPEAWDTWWRLSPLSVAHRVTTPTLILHSENDFRCPIEQAEQYFTALLRNGTPTELLRFPGEGHEMSRGGKPRHRVERFEAILDWHGRHLV